MQHCCCCPLSSRTAALHGRQDDSSRGGLPHEEGDHAATAVAAQASALLVAARMCPVAVLATAGAGSSCGAREALLQAAARDGRQQREAQRRGSKKVIFTATAHMRVHTVCLLLLPQSMQYLMTLWTTLPVETVLPLPLLSLIKPAAAMHTRVSTDGLSPPPAAPAAATAGVPLLLLLCHCCCGSAPAVAELSLLLLLRVLGVRTLGCVGGGCCVAGVCCR